MSTSSNWYCLFVIYVTQITNFLFLSVSLTSMNPAASAIKIFINESYYERNDAHISSNMSMVIITLAQSMILVGSLLGSVIARFVVCYLSRRGSVIFTHSLNVIASICMGPVAIYLNSYEAIVVGRLLSGIARGVGFTAVPLLIAETAPRKSLGRYVSISGWVVMLGYAVGNSLGHRSLLGNVKFWPFLLCVPGLFSLIYLFCSMWFPQTPAWLLSNAKNNNNNKIAFLLLRKLRNGTDIEIQNELDEIIEEINIDRNLRKTGVKELLCRPKYRFQLVLTILLVCSLQTTGVSAVAMYSDDLFHAAGVHGDYATYASIGMYVATAIMCFLINRAWKRVSLKYLHIGGLVLSAVSLTLLMLFAWLQHLSPTLPYCSVVVMVLYTMGVGAGPGLSFIALPSELNTHTVRPVALSVAFLLYWFTAAMQSIIVPFAMKALKDIAYLPFVVLTLLQVCLFIFKIPNTKGRNVQAIQDKLERKRRKSNQKLIVVDSFTNEDNEKQFLE